MRDTEVSGHRLDHGHELSLSSSSCLLTSIRCSSNLAAYRWECLSMHWELGEPGIHADRFSHVSLALFLPVWIPHSSGRPLPWCWLCPQQKWNKSVESSLEKCLPGLPGTLFLLTFFVLTEVRTNPWRRALRGGSLGGWEETRGSNLFLFIWSSGCE